jgi:hypothetical protein
MQLGILGSRNGLLDPIESIRNTADLRSWFISRYLSLAGHDVSFYKFNWKPPVLDKRLDHLICTINNGGITRLYEREKIDICKGLRKMVKGYFVEMSDHSRPSIADLFCTMVPEPTPVTEVSKVRYIGWAADDTLLIPKKPKTLTVFVDHSLYVDTAPDYTKTVMEGIKRYATLTKEKINVIQLRNEGLKKVNLDEPFTPEIYDRKLQVPYPEVCDAYKKAHIFVVTHAESLGLSVIESAMAGANILLFPRSIKEPLVKPLYHSLYDPNSSESVRWAIDNFVKSGTTPGQIRSRALEWTWTRCIARLVSALERRGDERKGHG